MSKALRNLPGVSEADVAIGSAKVTYDPAQVTLDQMRAAIDEEGYDLTGTE